MTVVDGTRPPRPRKAPTAKAAPPPARVSTFAGLLALVGVLNVVGLVMVLSASSAQAAAETGSTWGVFTRQAMWMALGAVALAVMSRVDYRRWRKITLPLLVLAVFLLVLVLIPGFGVRVNGATSWLGRGAIRFQPSEFAKLAVLLFVADLLARRADRITDTRLSLRPVVTVLVVVAGLLMLEPDLGTTLALGGLVFSLLLVAGVPLGALARVMGTGTAVALGLALSEPYRRDRLLAFLHPEADPLNVGYQPFQSLVAVSSGGLFGLGLGQSKAKWGFLPNAHTDFIFAIICEELGLVGGLLVIGLFLAFGVFGVRAALHAPDRFGMLVAAGVTAWVLTQALINLGGVVGLLPITGITLPFVSFGGSSLVVLMAATGILLNIAKRGKYSSVSRAGRGAA